MLLGSFQSYVKLWSKDLKLRSELMTELGLKVERLKV